jgi:hypothetical protein
MGEETPAAPPAPLEEWAVVEIYGHTKHAGCIQEVTRYGVPMLRIEVPEIPETPRTERAEIRRYMDYDASDRRVTVEEMGWWVRDASPAIPAEIYLYGGNAIFSIRPCTQEIALQVTRDKHPTPREYWVKAGPEGDPPAVITREQRGVASLISVFADKVQDPDAEQDDYDDRDEDEE